MNFEEAKLNPSAVFNSPADVVAERDLSQEQKLQILRQWEYDARELQVAEEENMRGGKPRVTLAEVLDALNCIAPDRRDDSAPSKQGGA